MKKKKDLSKILKFYIIFRNWVQKAFSSVRDDPDKDRMEAILKEKLTDAFTSGKAFTTNWDVEPLPL
jgi:hypothetical protein